MSTIAETTQNSGRPLFIECNGSHSSDQDEVPVQIKDPPTSDEEENRDIMDSMEFEEDIKQSIKTDDDSDVNDDLYISEADYCSLSDVRDDSSSCRVSPRAVHSDSLKAEVSDSSTLDIVKEEPCAEDTEDTVTIVSVPVRDPVTKEIKNIFVPVEVKDDSGLNIIKSILIPIKDDDGSVSYEIKKVIVPIKPELSLPKKTNKQPSARRKPAKVKEDKRRKRKERNEDRQKESVCPVCQKMVINKKQMAKHIYRNHTKPFRCRKCYTRYATQEIFQEHLRSHDPYVCPFCRMKYKSMSGLRGHQIRVHSTVEPKTVQEHNKETSMTPGPEQQKPHRFWMKTYACECCENMYSQQSYLVAHKRIAHGILTKESRSFWCNVSNKYFDTESNPQSRDSSYSQSYTCDNCGKSFDNKHSLRLHMRMHAGEPPYRCRVCSKSFFAAVALRMHRFTHTGERPYACDLCKRRFTKHSSMVTHRRRHPENRLPPPHMNLRSRKSKGDRV